MNAVGGIARNLTRLAVISGHCQCTRFQHSHLLTRSLSNMSAARPEIEVVKIIKQYIPKLSYDLHKGQCGRIGIVGGCEEYTGAPYFAAITALKLGADLVHVFCCRSAAPVIKSYSPELIVHPILDDEDVVDKMREWIPRLHSVVIGPGLGSDRDVLSKAAGVMLELIKMRKPLVIDADGLHLVTSNPDLVRGHKNTILTPNKVEFERLQNALGLSKVSDNAAEATVEVSKSLGGVTVVKKGRHDVIVSEGEVLSVTHEGSPRRCGGQGDLLSGAAAVFQHWIINHDDIGKQEKISSDCEPGSLAAYAACLLSKTCASQAFSKHGRSTTTTDLIKGINGAFCSIFN